MFKNKLSLFTVTFLSIFFITFSAEAKAVKIGVVNLPFVMQNSDKGKKALKYIEAQQKKEITVIKNKEKELRALVEDINKKIALMDPDLQKSKQDEAMKNKKELERHIQDSREKLQKKQQEQPQQIVKEIMEVVKAYGENENFTVVHQEGSGSYYFDKSINITPKIMDIYNNKK